MTKYLAIIGALLLAGCDNSSESLCRKWGDEHQKEVDAWMRRDVQNIDDFRSEIAALLPDNSCSGITPKVLRKVILDAQRIPTAPLHDGLSGGFGVPKR